MKCSPFPFSLSFPPYFFRSLPLSFSFTHVFCFLLNNKYQSRDLYMYMNSSLSLSLSPSFSLPHFPFPTPSSTYFLTLFPGKYQSSVSSLKRERNSSSSATSDMYVPLSTCKYPEYNRLFYSIPFITSGTQFNQIESKTRRTQSRQNTTNQSPLLPPIKPSQFHIVTRKDGEEGKERG